MTDVSQICVFIENKVGRISDVTETLGKADVNIKGFSVSDTVDYGVVRIICDNTTKAMQVLADAGFTVKESEVLCLEMENTPGSLADVLKVATDAGVVIEYVYSLISTYVVINVPEVHRAKKLLEGKSVRIVSQEEIEDL